MTSKQRYGAYQVNERLAAESDEIWLRALGAGVDDDRGGVAGDGGEARLGRRGAAPLGQLTEDQSCTSRVVHLRLLFPPLLLLGFRRRRFPPQLGVDHGRSPASQNRSGGVLLLLTWDGNSFHNLKEISVAFGNICKSIIGRPGHPWSCLEEPREASY